MSGFLGSSALGGGLHEGSNVHCHRNSVIRDDRNEIALINGGWRLLAIWECETDDTMLLNRRLTEFLGEPIC
jgi:G:T-mismatch repair DNA endonuclease (very short patch repair protein)